LDIANYAYNVQLIYRFMSSRVNYISDEVVLVHMFRFHHEEYLDIANIVYNVQQI